MTATGVSIDGASLAARAAVAADEAQLLAWRNDPAIVSQGTTARAVTAEEHARWFADALQGRARELFVLEADGVPAGALRYELESAEAAVSLYLLPAFQNRGLGRRAILATALPLMLRRGVRRLTARVRLDNPRSLRFFQALGFCDIGGPSGQGIQLAWDRPTVAHSRPSLGSAEAEAVQRVLGSCRLAQGPEVAALEADWCAATGASGAAAVGSGLGALRLALLAVGVGPGDEVVVPAYGCVALANAVLAVGAVPVAADVVPERWTLCPDDVRRRLTSRTRAIVAVHLFGEPADLGALGALGVPVIEDCAHGIGGCVGDTPFGAGGDASISSFYATKLIAAGEGGIVAARDPAVGARVRGWRDYADQAPDGRRLNDKLTDLAAAIARVQLRRLGELLERRRDLATRYSAMLAPLAEAGLLVRPPDTTGRIWYRYAVRLTRHGGLEAAAAMAALGVRAEPPVWDLRAAAGWTDGRPGAALAFERVLSLPLYPDLAELEQRLVIAALEEVLTRD